MQSTDRCEFARVLVGMAAVKPGGKLTAEALEIWWMTMRDTWSIEDFKSAAAHIVRTHEFMPSPYHFEQLRRASEATAGEAWVAVLSGASLPIGSRAYRAAQIVGGQQAIRHANIERDLPHMQRRFLDAYAELSDVDVVREALPQFVPDGLLRDLTTPRLLR